MSDLRTILERGVRGAAPPPDGFERMLRRHDRRRRTRRLTAGVIGIAVFLTAVWIVTTGGPFTHTLTPAATGSSGPVDFTTGAPEVDYVLDLDSGAMTPLPDAIIQSLGEKHSDVSVGFGGRVTDVRESGRYAASPGGSLLAYVARGDEGSFQIFVAGIDGSGIRQVTHDPTGATFPAWSPDGTRIAYSGYGDGDVYNLFVVDVATGESTQITSERHDAWQPQFTPDGSSLLFTGGTQTRPELRTVPVLGGESTRLIDLDEGLSDAGNGAISPDGSRVTFLGGGNPLGTPGGHCGPCRLVANVDGTQRRIVDGFGASPAGMWSPDGTRIVDTDDAWTVYVVDIATGHASSLAQGRSATWLDDHTLIVEGW